MALTTPQLKRARAEFADRYKDPAAGPCTLIKSDIDAAVAAVDAWIDANSASFNTALPQPFRGAASAEEKTALFMYVAIRRLRGDA